MRHLGLSYGQMQRKLFEDTGIHLSNASISYWVRGIHDPSGSLNRFRPVPSPELSYVIGVSLSDGNINVHDYHREILLSVTDKDFASEFSRCLGRVLGRGEPYKVRWSEKRGRWIVQGSSILLHKFLNCNWFDLRKWIEHCGKCLTIYNTDREMLLYIQDLLSHADIETTELHLNTKAGTRLIDSVLSSLRLLDGLDLLSSTPGITVVVGFPFTASPESPCALEARSLVLAGNGRTSTAPSRQ